jgi:energy-coupling factor transporter ATP-binding protein EcfA2
MKVGDQIGEVLEIHTKLSEADRRNRALQIMRAVHLPEPERLIDVYPHQLSGGQRQRIMIAAALVLDPALLIADEPTTALDVTTQAQILRLMRELQERRGTGVLFITHDFGVVAEVAHRVVVMQSGRVVSGTVCPIVQVDAGRGTKVVGMEFTDSTVMGLKGKGQATVESCLVTFRSLRATLCILIPLAIVSVLCEALMPTLGIGLKVSTLPVIALGVGVGVDYGIYHFDRIEVHLAEGKELATAFYEALDERGTAMVFTAVTMTIGVATWAGSALKFQADMGVLLAFMFFLNMLGALFLLPALAAFLLKKPATATR